MRLRNLFTLSLIIIIGSVIYPSVSLAVNRIYEVRNVTLPYQGQVVTHGFYYPMRWELYDVSTTSQPIDPSLAKFDIRLLKPNLLVGYIFQDITPTSTAIFSTSTGAVVYGRDYRLQWRPYRWMGTGSDYRIMVLPEPTGVYAGSWRSGFSGQFTIAGTGDLEQPAKLQQAQVILSQLTKIIELLRAWLLSE